MPVESRLHAVRLERLERLPILEKVRTGQAEHTAGVSIARQYTQPAVAVPLFIILGQLCGGECRFSRFPSPKADDIQEKSHDTAQEYKPKFRFHNKLD